MFKNHLYAETKEEAIKITQEQHPRLIIGDAYHDDDWKIPCRWVVEVFGRKVEETPSDDARSGGDEI